MISSPDYVSILSNVSRHTPLDLDRALFGRPDEGALVELDTTCTHQTTCLWPSSDPSVSNIGCRVKTPIKDPQYLAARLAAIALERQIHPIFLSYIADSGMQRFGFRVEQLSGLEEAAQLQCEAQLTNFWNFAIVFDASELEQLR